MTIIPTIPLLATYCHSAQTTRNLGDLTPTRRNSEPSATFSTMGGVRRAISVGSNTTWLQRKPNRRLKVKERGRKKSKRRN